MVKEIFLMNSSNPPSNFFAFLLYYDIKVATPSDRLNAIFGYFSKKVYNF